jgi:hypothetical protein
MPRVPSVIDQRRLRNGAAALDVSSQPAETIDDLRGQIEVVHDGIAALQSLDDLGAEANARAYLDEQELWKRMKVLEERLKQIEGEVNKP